VNSILCAVASLLALDLAPAADSAKNQAKCQTKAEAVRSCFRSSGSRLNESAMSGEWSSAGGT
jgi:hypothetical protein